MISCEEKSALLQLARDTITAKVGNRPLSEVAKLTGRLQEPGGAFVTIHKRKQLRGCIGLLESDLPLAETVSHMAVAAATEDSRFSPVRFEELGDLHIEISVLSPMRRVEQVRDIRLGIDGVLVAQAGHSGVFLPQVAQDTGWDLATFLSELCVGKAGLAADAWQDPETELRTFTVEILAEGV